MNARELYERLIEKGYQPPKCGDHHDGVYCCARDVYDKWETFPDASEAERLLRNYLELDRREVFRCWFHRGEGEKSYPRENECAADLFYLNGEIDSTISFILDHPDGIA